MLENFQSLSESFWWKGYSLTRNGRPSLPLVNVSFWMIIEKESCIFIGPWWSVSMLRHGPFINTGINPTLKTRLVLKRYKRWFNWTETPLIVPPFPSFVAFLRFVVVVSSSIVRSYSCRMAIFTSLNYSIAHVNNSWDPYLQCSLFGGWLTRLNVV